MIEAFNTNVMINWRRGREDQSVTVDDNYWLSYNPDFTTTEKLTVKATMVVHLDMIVLNAWEK